MGNNIEVEKIVSKIDKVFKQIDPNSKKQITELSENEEFRSKIENIKSYLQSYAENEIPKEVYDKAISLTDFCDKQYKILSEEKEKLEKQSVMNADMANILNEAYLFAVSREDFSIYEKTLIDHDLADYIDKLNIIKTENRKSDEYVKNEKTVKSKISNLQSNLHAEIDLDRINDKEKAITYISIELGDVLLTKKPSAGFIVNIEDLNIKIDDSLIEKYVPDNNKYAEYIDDSLIVIKAGILNKIANSKLIACIKNVFNSSSVKALNPGVTNNNN
ncbi:MAG: hypothetical protein PHH22_00760 [Clostridia bacterium]|nr:hypothetical protein [Clostridia bacterium]